MRKLLIIILTAFAILVICVPIGFLLIASFMGKDEVTAILAPLNQTKSGYIFLYFLPSYPTLKSYVELLMDMPEFFVMFWNTVKITLGILAGQFIFAVPAAWGFARYKFPAKRLLFGLYILLMMMPFQVTMLPDYIVLKTLDLQDQLAGIILPMIFSTFPVFIMYRFFFGISQEVMEAAMMDGAGAVRIFIKIGLPMGAGGVMASMVLGFFEYWNMVEQPMTFLKTKSLWPLSLYMPDITAENAATAFASSAVILVPSILVFLCGQSSLMQGITAVAVKE